ncbi:flavin reductase family protein [Taklimakanibacter deserti]|uniref:flavin reductase family protein n=1 Tax=Taklimakanibacter deserti TaxID=2267839 RepID=UPI000E651102
MTIAVRSPLDFTDHAQSLRDAMRHVAGGVSVITAGVGQDRTGLTVTSAISLSLDPPTMIVCVNRGASSWPVIQKHRHFCVNILGHAHREVAERFAGRDGIKGPERYAGASWTTLATQASVLDGAIAAIDCAVEEFIERHSHAIVIGEVKAVRVNGGEPLVYGHGRYGSFASA